MVKRPTNGGTPHEQLLAALEAFGESLTAKYAAHASGEPEDQLKPPVDALFSAYGKIISRPVILKGESTLEDRIGRPDFAAHDGKLPVGYVELKAPGKGANPELYKGHDRAQWKRFQIVPNLIYTDGNEWALYRSGKLEGKRVRLAGDVRTDGKEAAELANAKALFEILAAFTSWTPVVPTKPKAIAAFLAPFCRLIRDEVLDALDDSQSPMQNLKEEIKKLLFPDADDRRFADAYAQTVTFALLLAQLEGGNVLDLSSAYAVLRQHHSLLSRTLEFLTDPQVQAEIGASLSLAQRVIHEIPIEAMQAGKASKDPWLFFYEDFLAEYDPKLRKESGVYYTPLQVVRCQVRLVDDILTNKLGKHMGFVEPGVITLDPAVGTGTYLLGIVDHALQRVKAEEGAGAVKGGARSLVQNLHGFEWMVGPYSVAQLRFSQALTRLGSSLPPDGPGIYLTNTLESPHTRPPAPPLFHKPIAEEHERALKIKDAERVLVCLGNPPYGRHAAATVANKATTGGWVRHGGEEDAGAKPILDDFIAPATAAGHGVHMKNLYNQYVYFWRWALWKVFEHKTAAGPGVVSYISASSYLDGDAFAGMREHMRRVCDDIWIIDLGGEGRGTRTSENVFAIKTPVAIAIATRYGAPDRDTPARVHFTSLDGTRTQKLEELNSIEELSSVDWEECPNDWQVAFRPACEGEYTRWPLLKDLFPWQHSGAQFKRTWPIGPSQSTLEARWESLLNAEDRRFALRETRDRKIDYTYPPLRSEDQRQSSIAALPAGSPPPPILRYAYRSFDRQWILADSRLGDFLRPGIWHAHSDTQVYLTTLLNHPLGLGPALTVAAQIPDLHHFRGSYGAKEVLPLYRDAEAKQPNITPGLLDILASTYGETITPEDFLAYVYGVLAHPSFAERFAVELGTRELRVPITKNVAVFSKLRMIGSTLLWLHTYGERFIPKNEHAGHVPQGTARCLTAVSDAEEEYPNSYTYDEGTQTLHVGDGSFGPIIPEIYAFGISGLKVVQSWLGYRMRERSGKRSSPLDDIRPLSWTHDFTRELLELLWVLEATLREYPAQAELLTSLVEVECFTADELPSVPDEMRRPPSRPKISKEKELFDEAGH